MGEVVDFLELLLDDCKVLCLDLMNYFKKASLRLQVNDPLMLIFGLLLHFFDKLFELPHKILKESSVVVFLSHKWISASPYADRIVAFCELQDCRVINATIFQYALIVCDKSAARILKGMMLNHCNLWQRTLTADNPCRKISPGKLLGPNIILTGIDSQVESRFVIASM